MRDNSVTTRARYFRSVLVGWLWAVTWIATLMVSVTNYPALSAPVVMGIAVILFLFIPSFADIGSLFHSYEQFVQEQESILVGTWNDPCLNQAVIVTSLFEEVGGELRGSVSLESENWKAIYNGSDDVPGIGETVNVFKRQGNTFIVQRRSNL